MTQLKIDAYAHISPKKFGEALRKVDQEQYDRKIAPNTPLHDLDARFRIMDQHEGLVQVLTLSWPAIEESGEKAADLARLANDEMAELVFKYPSRFAGAIACLPMNDMDAALDEADRAVKDLRLRGVLVYSNIRGKALDSPEFMPLYEKMSAYNLPIYIHPQRFASFSDYESEGTSQYDIFSTFGWPYDTTVAMARLVYSGTLQKYPDLKIVTHHCGGMVPYFAERIVQFVDKFEFERGEYRRGAFLSGLTRAPIDYFKMFYNDTAINGNTPALMCANSFFGSDHLLFGADMPLGDRELGNQSYRKTINAIERMEITDAERKNIFEDNARKLMRLPMSS